MIIENICVSVSAGSLEEKRAADIFACEWKNRFGVIPDAAMDESEKFRFVFVLEDESKSEAFSVRETENGLTLTAHRLRGLIYAVGTVLKNITLSDGKAEILDGAFGNFSPDMPVRGHGIGYTDMSNTYEAWDEKKLRSYILDLMYFGLNTVETSYSPGNSPTKLMKYGFKEAFFIMSCICRDYDIELTLWYPLSKNKTDDETVTEILSVYGDLPKITSLFIPGGDPGDLQPEAFFERCRRIKEAFLPRYPEIALFPSAQAPHEYPDWREDFTKVMDGCPEYVDGIIYGPNHAMPVDELRRGIDKRYPVYHYPDISHNVRCETPVHFQRDDWHFAWASTLSRESVNPRPGEYALLHRKMCRYAEGQISYSEGVHDDVNKVIWSGLDFDYNAEPREIICCYSRLFFFGADYNAAAECIFGLEQNWLTAPETSVSVDFVYDKIMQLLNLYPFLNDSWRFNLLLFRASCDKIVRDRRIFELDLLKKAKNEIEKKDLSAAEKILCTEFSPQYRELRQSLFGLAEKLFAQVGIQLDTANFGGMSWERGCTLDTIDMPVTDRNYLLKKIRSGLSAGNILNIINRGKMHRDEYYFSFAFDGFDVCSMQEGEYYYDFLGDRNPDAEIPMCMTKNYDHFNFSTRIAGLTFGDYILRITYKDRNQSGITHHRLTVNGHCVYDGEGFGGREDGGFEKLFLPKGFRSIVYEIPAEYLVNGCCELEITEPVRGFEISEFYFERKTE